MRLIFLGSGTSHGIPTIGCCCPVCRSPDSRDKRTRASLYIKGSRGERVVIDTGPEFRLQALRAGIDRLDGVLLTHAHADHLHGLDDLRPLCWEAPLPVYGNAPTLEEVRERFAYVFKETQRGGGKPRLNPIRAEAPFTIGGLSFTPIPVKHGVLDILGWRIVESGGAETGAAYLTDVSNIPGPGLALLGQPETLILGALRVRSHPTHFNFEEALDTAKALGARQIYLTHISHEHGHRDIAAYCAAYKEKHRLDGVFMGPAWDGLELEV